MAEPGRGWRKQRTLITKDTTGRPVQVTTGLTTDAQGDEVVGLAIGNGPSAVVDLGNGSELSANLRLSLADLLEHRGGV